jgi:prevent-host-death family protein
VERGESITITKHDRPVARLVPVEATADREAVRRAAERLLELRKEVRLDGLDWKELRDAGRKY